MCLRGMLQSPFLVLAPRAARATAVAGLIVLAVATAAGFVRVLPWMVAREVPLGVILPFARGLLAVGLETALLCAPPIGWAISAARLVDSGEARALHAIGVRPCDLVASTVIPAALVTALSGLAALAWGTEAAAPGRLARALLSGAYDSCADVQEPKTAQIPLLHTTWVCFPGSAPRLTGALPMSASGTFSASAADISDDLERVDLSDVHAIWGEGKVRVHASRATFHHLTPFGRASTLAPLLRCLLLASTGALLALGTCWVILRIGCGNQPFAVALGLAGPVASLAALTWVERHAARGLYYASIPGSGIVLVALVTLAGSMLLRRLR